MKIRLAAIFAFVIPASAALAQWSAPNPTTGSIYYNGGNVGIGTDAPVANPNVPQTGVEVKSSSGTAALWLTGTSVQGAAIRGRNMNAGSTASAMDDIFLAMGGLGYDGSAFASSNKASIHFAASQAWTSANQGTYITFNTTPNNSTARAERMRIDNAGNVTIGTNLPNAPLTASLTNSSTDGSAVIAAIAGNGGTTSSKTAYVRLAASETSTPRDWRVGMTDGSGAFKIVDNTVSLPANPDVMTISGPITDRLIHFNGTVDGTKIVANYQDVAEWVPAAERMPAGTVVIVGQEGNNTVTVSNHAYDTSVAGVVSSNPGILLGIASPSKAIIATTGRVRVRVDATNAAIRKGDLLVTSERPGMAMKSEPLDLGGTKIHRPGTLIGKALEPLASGEGEILVLLSLQ